MAGERSYSSVEICAGAGGQAIGLKRARFTHEALVEIDAYAAATLAKNFKGANVVHDDVRNFLKEVTNGTHVFPELDLLAGGVPCPPFSMAGKQLGPEDERDLFPTIVALADALKPKAVMIENVRGLVQAKFDDYRRHIVEQLGQAGYVAMAWDEFQAADFGVPQLRPRSILVALRSEYAPFYTAPTPTHQRPGTRQEDDAVRLPNWVTVGKALRRSMAKRMGDPSAVKQWAAKANDVAPTLVGGSKKHGGADLGPTRAKARWADLGVDGHGLADDDDKADLHGPKNRGPRLTVAQAAVLQGFPSTWKFSGGKTARYRQVGNAFPPAVAEAVASQIRIAIEALEAGKEPPEDWEAPTQDGMPRNRRVAVVRQRVGEQETLFSVEEDVELQDAEEHCLVDGCV